MTKTTAVQILRSRFLVSASATALAISLVIAGFVMLTLDIPKESPVSAVLIVLGFIGIFWTGPQSQSYYEGLLATKALPENHHE